MNQPLQHTTRLAPSPTGALHLGNARTFLINWALARQNHWRVLLRIEDLDTPRIKPGADRMAIEDLRWMGLDWDHPDSQILYQLADLSPYLRALQQLQNQGVAYPCVCTRKEIEAAASAPQAGDHEIRYPGTCRHRTDLSAIAPSSEPVAWRLIVPPGPVAFTDQFAGPQTIDVDATVGDFVISTKAGLPAYQLAVVVDDHRQNVTHIVRGDDLIPSTGRQLHLYRALGLGPIPTYWHLPLVLGPDGRRLAKRHGDTRLSWYRDLGVSAERLIGLLAFWSGITPARSPMSARQFAQEFALQRLSYEPVTFTPDDHQWLLQA